MPSARAGIVLTLKYKNFNRSNIVQIPKWSSHCLYDSIGSISNVSCEALNSDCEIVVHTLGETTSIKNKNKFLIDDSSDSLPTDKFKSCLNSKISEVISLPKIIGTYCGGLILTKNESFYNFLKKSQNKNCKKAYTQSLKKYECIISKKKNFEWHYGEATNFGLDFNTVENIYQNLKNFEKNKQLILKRKKIFFKKEFQFDNFRIGPCLLLKYDKKFSKFLDTRHISIYKNRKKIKYIKKSILPIHFTISDKQFNKKIHEISKK